MSTSSNEGKGGIVGLLLAAGASTRFGSDKLLHPLADGRPIALVSALNLRAALPSMLAVVRPGSPGLAELFARHGVAHAIAPRAAEGMGASLAQGVAAMAQANGWLIALADMPYVKRETLLAIVSALESGAAIAVPNYRGRRGHPVGFSARFGEALMELEGDEGARGIVREHAAEVVEFECEDAGVLADVDTGADLANPPR
jgi:molybdenum cofactor cytidylyltransferase